MQAERSATEEIRLGALLEYDILDNAIEQQFEDVTRLVSRLCNAPIAVINLIDRDRQWFVSEVGLGVRETPLDISICAHAILQPGLFIVEDTLKDPRFSDNPLVTGDPHLRYYAGALLETADGHALGTLCVLDYEPRQLRDDQKELIQVLARQVMKQLELRRLVRLQETLIKQRDDMRHALDIEYGREKRIAETLQRSLLMDPSECTFPGIEIAPRYAAAWDESIIGGDFYDVYALDADRVALVVGDVAGKGLGAAARTAEVKYALRAILHEDSNPGNALGRLNNFLCNFHRFFEESTPRFVATGVCVVNTRSGITLFANAGGDPLIIVRRDGSTIVSKSSGMPLGIDADVTYEVDQFSICGGDALALATDGISETRSGGQFLETEGFSTILNANHRPSLSDWADAVFDSVRQYGDGALHDDMCVVMARLLQ